MASKIKALRDFFLTCPLLDNGRINVNYLSENAVYYSIEPVPHDPVIRSYVDGGSLNQYVFVFASREFYDEEVLANMAVAEFYEEFSEWVSEMSDKGILPQIGGGTPISLETLSTGYAYDLGETSARFQIQLRLIYRK